MPKKFQSGAPDLKKAHISKEMHQYRIYVTFYPKNVVQLRSKQIYAEQQLNVFSPNSVLYDLKPEETLYGHTSQNSFNKWTKISSLEIIIFELTNDGLEFILKLTEPLQRYLLSCQANSAILGRYFCTGQQQL